MNLARLGEESVERFGEYVSLAFEDREYTNVEQQRAASRLAHALTRLGVAEGDRVVVMLPNCPEVLQSYAAILKAGAVIVPVVFLLSAEEVRHILADSEAKEGWPGTVIMVGGGGSGLAYDDLVATESDRFTTRERGDTDSDGRLRAHRGLAGRVRAPPVRRSQARLRRAAAARRGGADPRRRRPGAAGGRGGRGSISSSAKRTSSSAAGSTSTRVRLKT